MKRKILSLLIAGIMLLGQGLSVCTAAPRQHHKRPAVHGWFNFWHRGKNKPAVKKSHTPKKHKIKKKNSNHSWFKWSKNKQNIRKKHHKNVKKYEKNKKHVIKKTKKQPKNCRIKNKHPRFKRR